MEIIVEEYEDRDEEGNLKGTVRVHQSTKSINLALKGLASGATKAQKREELLKKKLKQKWIDKCDEAGMLE